MLNVIIWPSVVLFIIHVSKPLRLGCSFDTFKVNAHIKKAALSNEITMS